MLKMIQPNCRAQFAAEDIEFILSVLGRKLGTAECLVKLLADEESRDLILDDEALFHALLERRGCLRVSSRLLFLHSGPARVPPLGYPGPRRGGLRGRGAGGVCALGTGALRCAGPGEPAGLLFRDARARSKRPTIAPAFSSAGAHRQLLAVPLGRVSRTGSDFGRRRGAFRM